jgi:uncharacterized lipoprotein YajG
MPRSGSLVHGIVKRRTPRLRALVMLLASAGVSGCAGPAEPVDVTNPARSAREEACVRLLRDLRLYCKEGLRDERATSKIDCLSRRLDVERTCY